MLTKSYGAANRETKSKNTAETRFNVGSIGKIFTRTALAQLAEQGKVSLDDKLFKYLPDFPHADAITIDMLAQHRSGVGDFFESDRYDALHAKLKNNHDYLELIREQPLWFEPGTSKRYSNGGYVLLGEVIAKASGEDYFDYLQKHVFGPAGMTSTGAPVEGDGTKGLAHGYTLEDGKGYKDNVDSRPARGSAAGGSYSTVSDLLSLDQALINAKLCGQAWSDWVIGGPRPDMTSGATSAGGSPSFGFAGGAPGISAEWNHEGDRTLIVLTNQDPPLTGRTLKQVLPIFQRMMPAPRTAPAP
jgi:CubicO group peptidase (beta-lactamase class C family)